LEEEEEEEEEEVVVVVVVGCLTSDVDPLHTLDGRSHRFCPYPVVQMLEPLFLPVLLCGVQVLLFLGEGEEGVGAAEVARLPPSERPIVLGSGFTRRVNKVA